MKILLVDDKAEDLYLLESLLKANNHEVHSARNGEKALQLLQNVRPDMIVSDILMPVVDGFMLCREIKQNKNWRTIPFVFYTATYTDKEDEELALKQGADRFLRKPMEPESFLVAIHEFEKKGHLKGSRQGKRVDAEIEETLELYNARLVNKLEKKMFALEKEIETRRQTEKALRISEERFRVLFNAGSDAMFVHYLPARGRQARFIEVNDIACERLGYSREELLKKLPADLFAPENVETANRAMVRLKTEKKVIFEAIRVTKGGKRIPVEINSTLFDFNGRNTVISISRDISERKKLEEQYYQAQKMESIGQLASGVAHDFNNLLTIINGYTDLLLANKPSDKQTNMLKHIHMASEQAQHLTQQLLAFSRKQVIRPKIINLNDIINNTKKMLRRLINENVALRFNLSEEIIPIKIDPAQLNQILMNMVVNARDAMRNGGVLRIETDVKVVDSSYPVQEPEVLPGTYARLRIIDDGIGMNHETQAKIFEPFFTTKPTGEGTGLGLATVYGIVKQNSGYIWVNSQTDKGTTFEIYFPCIMKADIDKIDNKKDKATPRGNETILLVEDDLGVRELLIRILSNYGYHIYSADSPLEAVRIFEEKENEIDLLMTDVIMPQMNGNELYLRLARHMPDLKVVYTSGYPAGVITEYQVLKEHVHFVPKPIEISQLLKTLRDALEQ